MNYKPVWPAQNLATFMKACQNQENMQKSWNFTNFMKKDKNNDIYCPIHENMQKYPNMHKYAKICKNMQKYA